MLFRAAAGLAVLPVAVLGPGSGTGCRLGCQEPRVGAVVTLEVDAGHGGALAPGEPLPVRVEVDVPTPGPWRMEVRLDTVDGTEAPTTLVVPVEATGEEEVVTVTVPTPADILAGEVTVRLLGREGEVAQGRADVAWAPDEEVLALLPGLVASAPPGPVPLPADAGTARFVSLVPAELSAPGQLATVNTVAAAPGELATLEEPVRAALLAWVEHGGRLLVDGPVGQLVDPLPRPWQPGPTGRAAVGLGEVRLTGGAAAAGLWATIMEPTPMVSPRDGVAVAPFLPVPTVADAVARDAGVRVPELGWLPPLLVLYVAVAGPVAFVLFRRSRRSALLWVALPALALLTSGVAYGAGRDVRHGSRRAHGTLVEAGPAGSRATSFVGVVSADAGDATVAFTEEGWTAGTYDASFSSRSPTPVQVSGDGRGPTARMELAAGELGVITGTGPTAVGGPLEVQATADGSGARGSVRNRSRLGLEQVAVFAGGAGVPVGDLAAGEQARWSLRGPVGVADAEAAVFPEAVVWPEAFDLRRTADLDPDGVVGAALWAEELRRQGVDARAPGTAVAVGWTRRFRPPVETGDDRSPTGRTAVISRAPITVGDEAGALPRLAVARELLRVSGGVAAGLGAGDGDAVAPRALFRFALPPQATAPTPPALTLAVPGALTTVEAWTALGWVTLDEGGDRGRTVPLPAVAVRDNVVLVRVGVDPTGAPLDVAGFTLGSSP